MLHLRIAHSAKYLTLMTAVAVAAARPQSCICTVQLKSFNDIFLEVYLSVLEKKKKSNFTVRKNHTKRKLEYVSEHLLYFVN